MKFFSSVKNRIISVALVTVLIIASIYGFTNFFTQGDVYYNMSDFSELLDGQFDELGEYYNFLVKDLESDIGTPENPFTILEIVPDKCQGIMGYYIPGCEPFSVEYLNTNYPNESDKSKGYLSGDNDLCKGGVYTQQKVTITHANGNIEVTPDNYWNNADILVSSIFGRSSYGEVGDKVTVKATTPDWEGKTATTYENLDGGFKSQVISVSPQDMMVGGALDERFIELIQSADFIYISQQVASQNVNLIDLYMKVYGEIYGTTYDTAAKSKRFTDSTANDIPWPIVKEIFYRQAGVYGRKAACVIDMAFKDKGNMNCGALYYLLLSDKPEDFYNRFLNGTYDFTLDSLEGLTWSHGGDYNNGLTIKAGSHQMSYVKKKSDADPIDWTEKFFGDGKSVRDHTMVIGGFGNFLTNNFTPSAKMGWYIDDSLAEEIKKTEAKDPSSYLIKDVDYANFQDQGRYADLSLSAMMKYVYGRVTNYKNVLRILEVEPVTTITKSDGTKSSAFRIRQNDLQSIKDYVGKCVDAWFDGKYEITNMTYAEFNTKKFDLQSDYDMVYIGTNGMTNINDSSGGNLVTFPDRTSGWNGYNKYLLTCKRYIDLLSFSRVGAVVYLDPVRNIWSGCNYKYNDTGEICNLTYYERLWVRKVGGSGRAGDTSLKIYRFGYGTEFGDYRLPYLVDDLKNQIAQTKIQIKGVAGAIPEDYIGVGSKSNTGGKAYTNNITTTGKQLAFKVNVSGYTAGDYELKLFVDKDGDDNFQMSTAKIAYLDNARYGTVSPDHRYSNESVPYTLYTKGASGNWTAKGNNIIHVDEPAVVNGKQQKAATVQYMVVSDELDNTGYVPWQIELVRTGNSDEVNPLLVNDYGPAGSNNVIRGNIRSVINGATWIKGESVEEIKVLQIETTPNASDVHYNTGDMLFTEDEVRSKYKITYDYTTNPAKANLFDYDVVVIGMSGLDTDQKIISNDYKAFETDLMKYIQSGKGIVFTQNSLNESHDDAYSIDNGFLTQDNINFKRHVDAAGNSTTSYKANVYTGQSEVRPYLNISNFLVDDLYTATNGESVHFNNFGKVTSYPYYLNDCEVGPEGNKTPGINVGKAGEVGNAAALKFAVKIDLPNYVNNEVEVCDSDTYGTVMNAAYDVRGGDGSNLSYLMSACNTYYIGFNINNCDPYAYEVSDAEKLFVNTLIAAYRKGKDVDLDCHNVDLAVDNVNNIAKGYLELNSAGANADGTPILAISSNSTEITADGLTAKLSVWVTDSVNTSENYEIAFLDYLDAKGNTLSDKVGANEQSSNKFDYYKLVNGESNTVNYTIDKDGNPKSLTMSFTDYANLAEADKAEFTDENGRKHIKVGMITFNINSTMIDDSEGTFKVQLRPYVESGWYWKPHQAYGVATYEIDLLEMLMFNLN